MKNKAVMKLFAVMLAVALTATSLPATAVPVYADESGTGSAEETLTTKLDISLKDETLTHWVDVTEATGENGISSVINSAAFDLKKADAGEDGDTSLEDVSVDITWYEGTVGSADDAAGKEAIDISGIEYAGVYSYVATVTTDGYEGSAYGQVTVGVDLSEAKVSFNGVEDDSDQVFPYTGQEIKPAVTVTYGEDEAAVTLDADKYAVRYMKADEELGDEDADCIEPEAYTLWIVPSTAGYGTYYNKTSANYSISSVTVDDSNVGTYLDYSGIADLDLTYDGHDQELQVHEAIAVKDEYSDAINLYDNVSLSFKKLNEEGALDQDAEKLYEIIGAGKYNVYVEMSGNCATAEPVQIGTVTMKKAAITLDDISVDYEDGTYYGGPIAAWALSNEPDIFSDEAIKLSYKQVTADSEEVVDGEPVNAGTYKVYAAVEDGANYDGFESTDTGKTITIAKQEPDAVYGEYVIGSVDELSEDDMSISYGFYGYIDWILEEESIGEDEFNVSTKLVNAADEEYVTDIKFTYNASSDAEDPDSQVAVSFKLTEAAKNITGEKRILIHVDFGDSFKNYNVAFDIPVVITDKVAVDIPWSDRYENLTYNGEVKTLTYDVVCYDNEDFTAIENKSAGEIDNFKVQITKDGESVSEIKNAGLYKVEAEYDDGTYYGKSSFGIWVNPQKVESAEALAKLLSFKDLSLSYNLENRLSDISGAISILDDGLNDGDYRVILSKGGEETGEIVEVGTYDVYIAIDQESNKNYYTEENFKLGTVTIGKGTIDLTVTVDSKGNVTSVKAGNAVISTDDVEKLYYDKDGNELDAQPTAAGTYKVKVTYTDDNLTAPATGEATFTISSSSSGGSTGGGGGASGGTTTDPGTGTETKTETTIETKADGTKVVTTTETKADGTKTVTVVETATNGDVKTTVTVKKDSAGKITSAKATVVNTVASGNKAVLSAAVISQITEAAGTKDVTVTMTVKDSDGNTKYKVKADAGDLKAGNKLYIYKLNTKTGEYTMVDAKTYKVTAAGSVSVSMSRKATYELVDATKAAKINKQIKSTIKPKKTSATVKKGKKTTFTLSSKVNMDNIKSIKYSSSNKSVATVSKTGKITAKKAGTVTIKAKVTLKNGSTKTISMKIKVK